MSVPDSPDNATWETVHDGSPNAPAPRATQAAKSRPVKSRARGKAKTAQASGQDAAREPRSAAPAGEPEGQAPAGEGDATAQEIKGLGSGESIIKTIKFDGDTWHVLRNSIGFVRMVQRVEKDETITLVQIVDGLIQCHEIRSHVSVDRKTRRIGSAQNSVSYRINYSDNQVPNYGTWTDTLTSDELNKDARPRWAFLSRLGLDAIVKSRKYPAVVELIKAVCWDARNTATRVRVINQSGLVIINDVTHYANASGTIIGPDGEIRTDVVCEPRELDQYQDIGYSPIKSLTMDEQITGLTALQQLLAGHNDMGITSILTGQLIGSLMAGSHYDDESSVNSVSALKGDTETGKTAYAMAVFTSQTQNHHGEILPAIIGRIAVNGGSAGATPAGIYHKLKSYSSVFALIDDTVKKIWEPRDKKAAHDKIIERCTSFIVGGATPQAQPDAKNGGTTDAPAMHLELSGVITLEDWGIIGPLMGDATYNRIALVWWDRDGRAPREVFQRLISQECTRQRNDGMSVCLSAMLKNPAYLTEGYRRALDYLRANLTSERVAKSYARCLAGIYVLEILCQEYGIPNDYTLDAVLPHALKHAQMLESHGSNGGDELAISDPVEATREAFRILIQVKRGGYATAPVDSRDVGKGLLPEPPELPEGQEYSVAGWFRDQDKLYTANNAIKIGEIKPLRSNGRPGKCPYRFRLECTADEWTNLATRLGEINHMYHHAEPSRLERLDALRKNPDIAMTTKVIGKIRHYINWEWLTGQCDTPESDITDDDGDDQ